MVIWITGLSGAGKTTLCEAIAKLVKRNLPELVLVDGDAVREIFGSTLGYAEADRRVQIGRIQSICKVLDEQNIVVLAAALYAAPDLLKWNRDNFSSYFEVYIDASLELVQSRDPKGLYASAATRDVPQVVGMDIPWHAPKNADLVVNMAETATPEQQAMTVISQVPRLSAAIS